MWVMPKSTLTKSQSIQEYIFTELETHFCTSVQTNAHCMAFWECSHIADCRVTTKYLKKKLTVCTVKKTELTVCIVKNTKLTVCIVKNTELTVCIVKSVMSGELAVCKTQAKTTYRISS